MKSAQIGVLIPALELGEYCRRAVESVLSDTSAGPVQVSLVVDGPEIETVPTWARQVGIELQFTGRRSGSAAALNLARKAVDTPVIARLDYDDLSYPGRFRAQLEEIDRGAIVVGTRANLIGSKDQVIGEIIGRFRPLDPRIALLHNNPFAHSSVVVRTDHFDAENGYDTSCIRMQDYDLFLRLALRGQMSILSEKFVGYRLHDGQTSRKMTGFVPLMRNISNRRSVLASHLRQSSMRQHGRNAFFIASQAARYSGLRRPGYYRGVSGA